MFYGPHTYKQGRNVWKCEGREQSRLHWCPGFGQDRVNFHRTPGRGTAGQANPTWPNRAGYSIPCVVMVGSGGGERGGRNSLTARERAAAVVEGGSVGCAVCVVFFSLSVLLLFLFPLFAVLLNCPYPNRPTSCCLFLSVLLRTTVRGGAAAWCFCCWLQPNHNI